MHPTHLVVLLNGQHLITEIYIYTLKAAAATKLAYYLTTQNTRAQVVRRHAALNLLHPQTIAIVALRQHRARSVCLLPGSIVLIALIAIVGEIAGSIVAHARAVPGIGDQTVVHVTGPLLQPWIEPSTPAHAIPQVTQIIVAIRVPVWTVLRATLSNQVPACL